jgi:flagellar M-ring protein FliF
VADVDHLKRRAQEALAGFTSGQKAMLAVAVVALLVGGLLFTRWAGSPDLVPLYSSLPASSAAGVTEELTSRGVPFSLADGGSTILVPRKDVYQLRLDLSAEGLPEDDAPGYALLDKQGITTSEFRQRVDYQRALEGELSKTISAIDGVDGATVHLVIPADTLFTDDLSQPTASVLLETRGDTSLSSAQVRAVVHLVASSVEGLQPTQVTVTDSSGRLLSTPGEEGGAAGGDLRAEQTAAFERELSGSIEQLLSPVTGAGRVKVRVSADLDFDQRSTTTERFAEPGAAPVVSETTTNETYAGTGDVVGGVLGPDPVPAGEPGQTDYSREQAERSYAVGKVTEEVQGAPGAVERLSVAVLVDGNAAGVDDQALSRLVAAAAGIDVARGDTVEISRMAFDDAAADTAEAERAAQADAQRREQMMGLARTVAIVVIVLLVLAFAYRSARKATVARTPVVLPAELTGAIAELDALNHGDGDDLDDLTGALSLDVAPPPMAAVPAAPSPGRLAIENEISALIDQQPDEVAQVLRGWLADRRP